MASSYIDTCYLMALVDPNDKLRSKSNIGRGKAESITGNLKSIKVPLPAYSEALCKTEDHYLGDRDRQIEIYSELNRLRNKGFIEVEYINDPEVLKLASEMAKYMSDDRDQMSIMDSLIVATASADPECRSYYTEDVQEIRNARIWDLCTEFRERKGFENPAISVQRLWKKQSA